MRVIMGNIKKSKKFTIIFATSNPNKVREVKSILKGHPITIKQKNVKGPEIQSEDLEDVAKTSVLWAAKKSSSPTIVEDAGLFIEALKGFPGASSSYVYKTIGKEGVLKLLEGETNRRAVFESVVAYSTPNEKPICFLGEVRGRISLEERGIHGFGFDPIFEPENGGGKTFGEMETDEKNRYSHRALAVRRFAEWILKQDIYQRGNFV